MRITTKVLAGASLAVDFRMNRHIKKLLLPLLALLLCIGNAAAQSDYSLRSPNKRIEVRIRAADRIQYDVLLNGQFLLRNSTASFKPSESPTKTDSLALPRFLMSTASCEA